MSSGKVTMDRKEKAQKQNIRVRCPPTKTGGKKKYTSYIITLHLVKYKCAYMYVCARASPRVSFHFAAGYKKRMKVSDQPKMKQITRKRFKNLRHYEVPA